jgi:mRNA-degrading endonuclease RelE of RelBE toxin-antitoxin system
MVDEHLRRKIFDEISGARTQDDIRQIANFNRIPGTTGFDDAIKYAFEQLKRVPVFNLQVRRYPVKKGQKYWDFLCEHVWEPQDARLRLIKPEKDARVLVKYEEEPIKLFANSFPVNRYVSEVVFISNGERPQDYAGKRVKGRVVLLDNPTPKSIFMAICRFRAKGIITSYTPSGSLELPDIAGRVGFITKHMKKFKPFGFSLTKREFEYLKKLVFAEEQKGKKVVVEVSVKARFRKGEYRILTGVIPGRQDKEFIIVAHLCHPKPSANDNASGVALSIEIARVLATLIKKKTIPQPLYTIRFLFVPEWVGTLPWIMEKLKKMKNVIGVVSLDMVGEDQQKCGSTLGIYASHNSIPSFINDLFEMEIEEVSSEQKFIKCAKPEPLVFATKKYIGATDNLPFSYPQVKVPAVALVQWPDNFYHSTQDTVDKTSQNILAKTGLAVISVFLSLCDTKYAPVIAERCYLKAKKRIDYEYEQALLEIAQTKKKIGQKLDFLQKKLVYRVEIERQMLGSIKRLHPLLQNQIKEYIEIINRILDDYLGRLCDFACRMAGKDVKPASEGLSKQERSASKLVPVRKTGGLICMFSLSRWLSIKDYERFLRIYERTGLTWDADEAMYWIDGKRTLLEIYRIMQYEGAKVSLDVLMKYLKITCKTGLLAICKKSSPG